jgi:hypothetical protein
MTDLNLNNVLVLALALEIIETDILQTPRVLEGRRFIGTKAFNAYDLHVVKRKHLDLAAGLFDERQLRAIQIKNVLSYLENSVVYVPEEWGKPKGREISYEEAKWVCEKYQAEQQNDPLAVYSPMQLRAIATGDPTFLDGTKWLNP